MNKNIGIIGFGNMGSAIAQQLKADYRIFVYDKDKSKTKNLAGINVSETINDLIKAVEVLILAVKPQDFEGVLKEIKGIVQDRLIISIAAGITTKYIEKHLKKARIIRVMPNIEVKIRRGITFVSKGRLATKKDILFVQRLFNYMGKTIVLDENTIDAATAISGSRLAYFCAEIEKLKVDYHRIPKKVEIEFTENLQRAAKSLGFDDTLAQYMSVGTGPSCQIFFEKEKMAPQELREKITSRGGTTEAALKVLNKGGSLIKAVKAAFKRAKALAKKE